MPAVATPKALARSSRRPRQAARPGRRQASSSSAAPTSRNIATAVGDSSSNNPTAMAAPTYIDRPPTTNSTGAGTRSPTPREVIEATLLSVTVVRRS
jgi:hypothetical protein